jgi:hypothetical protein
MELYGVVIKLVGPVMPIGETREDEKRLENLKVLCDLIDKLLTDIDDVAQYSSREEYSMKTAGIYASKFIDRIGIV